MNATRRTPGLQDNLWCRAYACALYLYPRQFRRRFAADMSRTFAVRLVEARRERGRLGAARYLVVELAGLGWSAARERLRGEPTGLSGRAPTAHPNSGGESPSLFIRELRHACRRLARSPAFTTASVLTLSLGVGATTAVFSLVYSTVIRPLPYPESDRLVWLDHAAPGLGAERGLGMTDGLFVHYTEQVSSFERMAMWTDVEVTLADGEPERVRAVATTPSLFSALRVTPARGRVLTDADAGGAAGASGAAGVVVISHGLWTRRFGAEPEAIGRQVRANGFPVEIVGVMPQGFEFPHPDIDMWAPLPLNATTTRFGGFSREGIARLAPGASRHTAEAELRAVIPGLAERFGVQSMLDDTRLEPLLPTLKEHIVQDSERTLWILLGSVAFVLLLACANVANLLLVRAESRRRETAVRRALGAGATKIAQHFLSEGLLLSVGGAVLGLGLAGLAVRVVVGFGPEHLPRLSEISVSAPALLLAAGILLATTILFGLGPMAWSRFSLVSAIESVGRGATGGPASSRGRNVLVASQVCLALVLLVSTGLMVRSFMHLATLDPGFRAERALTFRVGLPQTQYGDRESAVAFHREALERIAALPGVEGVGATTCLPLCGRWAGTQLTVEGRPDDPNSVAGVVAVRRVNEAYFTTLHVPLVSGRLPSRHDQESGTGAAVISRRLAATYWPDEDPIGQRFQTVSGGGDWYTVVGIVENTPVVGLADDPVPMAYLPLLHGADGYASPYELAYLVRTSVRPQSLLGAVREVIRSLDAEVPLSYVATMDEIISDSNVSTAFTTVVLGMAAGIALLLGVVGIYGVISYSVGRRASEIAIRLALGARPSQITRSVLAQGGRITAVGAVLGIVAAAALTRVLKNLLYGISPTDPLTFVAMGGLLLLVALTAAYLPARRAARVDPARTLRSD